MASEIERLDQLLSAQETRVRRAFLRYIQLTSGEALMGMVLERLEAQDVDGAMGLLESYIAQLGDVLPEVQLEVGRETAGELGQLVRDTAVAVSFDASNPRAAALVRTQRLGLIREFTRGQFRAVQQAVNRAVGTGVGAQGLARAFRNAIGLTAQQEAAVESFRLLLVNRSRAALERLLRDRRFDDRVRQAVEMDRPLTERQIRIMTARYRARAIALRAETIARTEAGRAYSDARDEALAQMTEQTGIERDRVIRVWNRTEDRRVRDWHDSMQGQTRGIDEPFEDGRGNRLLRPHDPAAPAETTINCRCTLTYRLRPSA